MYGCSDGCQHKIDLRFWFQYAPGYCGQMPLRERMLYHQIHPAKLGTDILAEFISLYFFWQHDLVIGLVTHFIPPIIASWVIICFVSLDRQKASKFGHYLARFMSHAVEATLLAGDIAMAEGPWYRSPVLIAGGLLIVVFAWLSGILRNRAKFKF
jgi:hypothetical protein